MRIGLIGKRTGTVLYVPRVIATRSHGVYALLKVQWLADFWFNHRSKILWPARYAKGRNQAMDSTVACDALDASNTSLLVAVPCASAC